ncbi:FecR domain-containing protein [Bacteroides sp. CR5/BHMF/2]|nr:FecR domain-containing protein [Bacteroides sp. CR5/BHMF/2]
MAKENNINQQVYTFVTTKTSIDSLPDNKIDYQAIYNRIKGNIDKNEQLLIEEPMRSIRKTYALNHLWKYAAVFFFGIISAATAMYLIPSGSSQAISEITVPKGSVSEIILPDSSVVTINSNSKLSYANDFLTGKRVVNLEGEAFSKSKSNSTVTNLRYVLKEQISW